jgi:seryl-tRNA synthetase
MATATLAPMDALATESAALEKAIAELNAKVEAERRNLATLTDERTRLIEAIGLKKEKPEKAVALAAQISGAESVIAGLVALIAPKQQRLDAALTDLRHLREDAARQKELDEIARIEADGMAALSRIADALHKTLGTELVKLEESRLKLRQISGRGFNRFPAPPASVAANNAHNNLGKALVEKLDPVLKLIGR